MSTDDPYLGQHYGPVRLVQRLGQGAMGAVYQGWHERFACEVAVKILLHRPHDQHQRERFLREGRAAAKVRHPHVVQVMDAGEQHGVAYLIMELVKGHSLGHVISEHGPLPCAAVARLGCDIARGLAALHSQGIIHRDIKPDNILVGHDTSVKIADLGLAKQTDDPELNRLTATGMVVGTPLYVAPEAIREPRHAGPPADVYSFGATLYHALVGHPPFPAESPYEVMRAHLEQRPQPLREVRRDIPVGLAQLVARCLAKAPEQRPRASEIADLLAGGANLTANVSRGLLVLLSSTVVGVTALAGGVWWGLQHYRQLTDANHASHLTFVLAEQQAEVRVNQQPWAPLTDAPVVLPPGQHRVEIRARGDGPLRRALQTMTLTNAVNHTIPVVLQTVPVPRVRFEVPGNGMAMVGGVAYGTDRMVSVALAGHYACGRWDGTTWWSLNATVDERGQLAASSVTTNPYPQGAGWWRSSVDERPTPPHHVVCWWHFEQLRQQHELAATPGWLAQGQRGEQPACGVANALLHAFLQRHATWAALPSPSVAGVLSGVLRTPLWADDNGRWLVIGGNETTAQVALVPSGAPVNQTGATR